jgi:hypothetical protein
MHITAVTGHASSYPEPISFTAGDRLILGRRDTEYPGWIWVTVPGGREGWAPQAYIRLQSRTEGIAACAYTARELDTTAGQRLIVHKELNGWLWVENDEGECGWVPKQSTGVL